MACALAIRGAAPDPWPELADPARRQVSAEAIADHFGFCSRHATALGAMSWPPGLAAAAADALGIVSAMLEDRARYEERLVQTMFRARQGCAACTVERRRTGIEPAESTEGAQHLCLAHYSGAAARADERQLEGLAAAALASARAWQARLEGRTGAEMDDVRTAQAWLAGETLETPAGHVPLSPADPACPICRAAARAHERWLERLSAGIRLGVELRGLLPLCPSHLRMGVEHGGPDAARKLVRQSVGTVAAALERGLDENRRAVQRDFEASSSVWYRRRAPSYVLGERRRALRLPRCGACERVELACQRAQAKLLDRLASLGERERLASAGDLCLRHFASVYLLCPHGEARAALAARQRAALDRIQAALTNESGARSWALAAGMFGAMGPG